MGLTDVKKFNEVSIYSFRQGPRVRQTLLHAVHSGIKI